MIGIQLDLGGGGKFDGFKNNFGRFFYLMGGGGCSSICIMPLICHRPLTLPV